MPTGDKKLKFFRPDPRTCRGNLLAQKQFPLPPAGDLTIVATRDAPRVVIFDNAPLGEIPPLGDPTDVAPYAIRHAADVAADIDYRFWTDPGLQPVVPSGIFIKGQESASNDVDSGFVADVVVRMRASVVGGADVIVSPLVEAFVSHRYEWVLVGTKDANARWVFIDRIVSRPSP